MAYPFQPPVENAYQIAGKALMQGGEVLGSMRDMIEKRKQALIAQRQAEIEAQQKAEALEMQKQLQAQTIASSKAEVENKAKEEARKAQEAERQQNFRNIANVGKAVPVDYQTEVGPQLPEMEGSPLNRNVERQPFSREEYLDEALRAGAIDPEKYASATRETPRNPLTKISENNTILERIDGQWIDTGVPVNRNEYQGLNYTQGVASNVFSQEDKLRDEFEKQVSQPKMALTAFSKLSQALERNNPADAYSAIINYVRTLDPNSTVREAEERLARERSAGGPLGALGQYAQNLKDGKLTDPIRKNLFEAGKGLAMAELNSYKNTKNSYKKRLDSYKQRGYNLDEDAVFGEDYEQIFNNSFNRDIFNKRDNKQPTKQPTKTNPKAESLRGKYGY